MLSQMRNWFLFNLTFICYTVLSSNAVINSDITYPSSRRINISAFIRCDANVGYLLLLKRTSVLFASNVSRATNSEDTRRSSYAIPSKGILLTANETDSSDKS